MSSQEKDQRHFLMTGDKFVDWKGKEFAVIERPRWSFRDLFRSSDQPVRVLSPNGTLLFQMPPQRTRDIDQLWIEDDSGTRIATLRRTGREAMTEGLSDPVRRAHAISTPGMRTVMVWAGNVSASR